MNQDRLKVLHITSGISPRLGGPSEAAQEMCRALADRGLLITLFTTNIDELGSWLPKSSRSRLDVPLEAPQLVEGVERWYFPVHWPTRYKFSPEMGRQIRSRIREFDAVHIHSLFLYPTLVAARHARRMGIPYVVRPHGTLDPYIQRRHRRLKGTYARLFQKRLLDASAAIHYTSHEERDLAGTVGIKAPEVVIPLGVDPSRFAQLPEKGRFKSAEGLQGKRLVVFLGRLTPKKGLDLLIPAFARLMESVASVHLVIAGPDEGGYCRTVRRLIVEHGIVEHATLVGMVTGIRKMELLADADVWVLPSYSENFGLAVVEAMACGLPVVITNKVNIHRTIQKHNAGVVVDCTTSQLAEAMNRILMSPFLAESLGTAARQLAASQFTWARCAEKLEELYSRILGRAGATSNLANAVDSGEAVG